MEKKVLSNKRFLGPDRFMKCTVLVFVNIQLPPLYELDYLRSRLFNYQVAEHQAFLAFELY